MRRIAWVGYDATTHGSYKSTLEEELDATVDTFRAASESLEPILRNDYDLLLVYYKIDAGRTLPQGFARAPPEDVAESVIKYIRQSTLNTTKPIIVTTLPIDDTKKAKYLQAGADAVFDLSASESPLEEFLGKVREYLQ